MTPCEQLDYREGDLFQVIPPYAQEYLTKGMILSLWDDDGSMYPGFKYVTGNVTELTETVEVIYASIYSVKKLQKFKVAEIAEDTKTIKSINVEKVTYSIQDIDAAWVKLHWAEDSKALLIKTLNEVTDPEYKEYLRLKQKYETE